MMKLIAQNCLLRSLAKYPNRYTCLSLHTTKIVENRKIVFLTQKNMVLSKLMKCVSWYEGLLDKYVPSFSRVYKVFKNGSMAYLSDFKRYAILANSSRFVKEFSLDELQLYHSFPRDFKKLAPVFIMSSLPFCQYFVLPFAYKYPKKCLTPHFWTPQQKQDFFLEEHKDRLSYYEPMFAFMRSKVESQNNRYSRQFLQVLDQVESGLEVDVRKLSECLPIFMTAPFGMIHLPSEHTKNLSRIHGLSVGVLAPYRRRRLMSHADVLHYMDFAIGNKKRLGELNEDQIRNICLMRGLHPNQEVNDELINWMDRWLIISRCITRHNYSLLLHCPLLLSYRHPSNTTLLK